tara:strand:- start:3526 stop:4422 length:897 start_codon:yes stop_codon:yes gene_type:complete
MSVAIVAVGAVAVGAYSAYKGSQNAKKANELAEANMIQQQGVEASKLATQREELRKMEKQKDVYRSMEFTNPYAENVMEDLTINQAQAEFEKGMFQQQQANVMQGLQGAAGGSGIGALAQSLAGAGAQQAQRASISIGQQERQNMMSRLQGEQLKQKGEALVEEKEMSRQSTLLGMQMGQLSGANQAANQAQQNMMQARAAQANMYGQQAAAQTQMAGQMMGTGLGMMSDRRLKKNINKIGESPSGLNIYSFEFINPEHGSGLYQGVMSDETPKQAVISVGGYDTVNYNMLDVEFKKI